MGDYGCTVWIGDGDGLSDGHRRGAEAKSGVGSWTAAWRRAKCRLSGPI